MILQHDDCQGYETYEADECATNSLATLHVLQKSLEGTLRYQLDGEDVEDGNTARIYGNLSSTQIGIVEHIIATNWL